METPLADPGSADEPIVGGEVKEAARARAAGMIGRTLADRYRIEELVAMGGLAAVFRATRPDGHEVAIKILHPEIEGLPELIERFEREAIAGKHILHPNVVAVHEIGQTEDGAWFLVQDFVRGRTLRELIALGPLPPLRAAQIARQVTAGLIAAHDMGIIHRDLKPLNIMIGEGEEGAAQLVDFGLARVPVSDLSVHHAQHRRSLSQAGVLMGTIAYIAPEAALGMHNVDQRADLYAVGLVLYEMLAGVHPFTATAPADLFAQQRHEIPAPIAERSPGTSTPPDLEAVVRRLLEKDPEARYPSARALAAALDTVIARLTRPPPDRAPRRVLAGLVSVALLLVAALSWVLLRGR
jgi:serine/threonine-protein kinase